MVGSPVGSKGGDSVESASMAIDWKVSEVWAWWSAGLGAFA